MLLALREDADPTAVGHVDAICGVLVLVDLGGVLWCFVVEVLLVALAAGEGPAVQPLRLLAVGRLRGSARRRDRDATRLGDVQQVVVVLVLVNLDAKRPSVLG